MAVLGFTWLVLVVVDLTVGLSPFPTAVNQAIWGLFVLQFAVPERFRALRLPSAKRSARGQTGWRQFRLHRRRDSVTGDVMWALPDIPISVLR